MPLKMTTETMFKVDYSDLEDFVIEFFGLQMIDHGSYKERPYSFVATEECNNYSTIEFAVTATLDRSEQEELEKWAVSNGQSWVSNSAILNHLAIEHAIPTGTQT